MDPENGVPEAARREVRRIVLLSRAAGGVMIVALIGGSLYLHRGDPASAVAIYQIGSVLFGGFAFITLSTLARQAHAGIIERTLSAVRSLSEQLKDVAERDPLTGLFNLRAFHERLSNELRDATSSGEQLSLVIADLDNFKVLNDSFGHAYGDQVLRQTARVFERAGGARAAGARLGGDEFAIVLPGLSRDAALAVTRGVERELAAVRVDERQPVTLGSFGIGTYPEDGDGVQALFAAADGRMYSEKHQRKAEALSSLAGASRQLFVSVGAAMRPNRSTLRILGEIVAATREQLALFAVRIYVEGADASPALCAVTATDPAVEAALRCESLLTAQEAAAVLPPEAWIIDAPIPDETGERGQLLLAGLPNISFRPDTPVVLALADLIQAVVANGRAHDEAARAGRERDIHIDLAHELASGGSLHERLARVVDRVQQFIGARSVSIEGLRSADSLALMHNDLAHNIVSGLSAEEVRRWEEERGDASGMLSFLEDETPCVLGDVQNDPRISVQDRWILRANGIVAVAVTAVRFDGEFLGILGASSIRDAAEAEGWLEMLTSIAEHLAPVMKVALLRDQLEASYRQLEQASRDSLARLADAAEARDPNTGGHLRRVRSYSFALAIDVGMSDAEAGAIAAASTVHDLGKLGLPDEVLMNPGKLDPHDWQRMMQHPSDGERLIGESPMFALERCVARWHHERWDGSGYPDGLAGEAIPLPARIVAVADAFDALTTDRPYKAAWTPADAVTEIRRASGSLFCPTVVMALERLWASGRLSELAHAADHGTPDGRPHAEPEELAA